MAEMTLAAHEWKSAEWALTNKLFSEIHNAENLDTAVADFAQKLSSYNPEALQEMKRIIWEGTEHWESLLVERASITGTLVLSDFSIRVSSNSSAGMSSSVTFTVVCGCLLDRKSVV